MSCVDTVCLMCCHDIAHYELCRLTLTQDRMVVVFENLKPTNLKQVKSCGMVMCGSNADHTKVCACVVRVCVRTHCNILTIPSSQVEPLSVPAGSKVGERVVCEGYTDAPDEVCSVYVYVRICLLHVYQVVDPKKKNAWEKGAWCIVCVV
jgi:tRNA-binding EMAP/Myf-like protein